MTDYRAATGATTRLHTIRRIAIITIIVSLSLTALIGIITLLTGSFGEAQGKIILTTLVIGVASVLALCDLAVLGRRFHVVGFVGIAVDLIGMVAALILIWTPWGDWFEAGSEGLWKTFGLACIAAVSLAQTNLLLLLGERRRTVVRTGLWVTIALITLVLVLLYLLVLTDGEISSDGYARFLGSAAILDVLGTILVPVISRFLRDEQGAVQAGTSAAPASAPVVPATASEAPIAASAAAITLHLSAELNAELDALATSTGRSRDEVALAAIADAVTTTPTV